ncbi:MAG: radical SAM protein [Acidobacteriota bacterium]
MPRPLNVILDLTARCNLKCVMCYFANTDRLQFPPFDTQLSDDGNMPVAVFERIAADLFPRAWRVALACAAEPMIHPQFREILGIAGRYGVPDLWFPTNLLALTEVSAKALIDANVRTVAASIDGVTKETYEKIRVPAKWERLMTCLDLFARVKKDSGSRTPRLRIIFTWMKSNREQLAMLPEFAAAHGAREIDVRFVSPTSGVDVTPELLSDEDPQQLNRELAGAAREAVRRGLKLASYPEFEKESERSRNLVKRFQRRLWRLRAGMDRPEYFRYAWYQGLNGCAYPDRNYVIRPNGAVNPCIYWDQDPIGFYPADGLERIAGGTPLKRIRDGLRSGYPVGTCASCGERRTALYRLRGTPPPEAATAHLPTHPR